MNKKAVSEILLTLLLLIGMLTLAFSSQTVRASGTICMRVGLGYDIAVINAGAVRLRIPDPVLGMIIPVFVAVENQGPWVIEVFEVSAFYDTALIGRRTVYRTLASGDQTAASINWDLESLPNGVYTISANASLTVPGETDTADNYFVNGEVLKTIFADVTGDGIVDLFDLFALGKAYTSTTPSADLNSDGIVNLTDSHIFLAALGSTVGSYNWNPYADLTDDTPGILPDDPDGDVDGFDLGEFADQLGLTGSLNWNLHADMNADNEVGLSDLLDLSENYGAPSP